MSTQPEVATSSDVLSYREAVCAALEDEMAGDHTVVLLGEDVGSAGGVFKATEGLLDRFGPERVLDTPICENGFVAAALGMSVTGLRPVVEIMFSDFLPTAGDAIVNELAKFRFMSGGQCSVPVTIRALGGGIGHFGSQHSAMGDSWFMGFPGLRVATAGTPEAAYGVLRAAIRDDNPVLVFEHKSLYGIKAGIDRSEAGIDKIGSAAVLREGSDATLVATLLMVERSLAAAEVLSEEGIEVEVVDLRWLRPLDVPTVAASVAKTGRLVVVEEQVHSGGWGATLISRLAMESALGRVPPSAVSMSENIVIPFCPALEDVVIPTVEVIAESVRRLPETPN